jgi:hypothetical protein
MMIFLPLVKSNVACSRDFQRNSRFRCRPVYPVCFPRLRHACLAPSSARLRDDHPAPAAASNYFNLKMISFGKSTSGFLTGRF